MSNRVKMAWRSGVAPWRFHFKKPTRVNNIQAMLYADGEFHYVCPRCGRFAHRHLAIPDLDKSGYSTAICPPGV